MKYGNWSNENKYYFIKWTDKILIKENVSWEKSKNNVLNWNTKTEASIILYKTEYNQKLAS
jgi:hypothetical protein